MLLLLRICGKRLCIKSSVLELAGLVLHLKALRWSLFWLADFLAWGTGLHGLSLLHIPICVLHGEIGSLWWYLSQKDSMTEDQVVTGFIDAGNSKQIFDSYIESEPEIRG